MKRIFSMFAKQAAAKQLPKQNPAALYTKVETFDLDAHDAPSNKSEIVEREEHEQTYDTEKRDSIILKNLAKRYVDLRVTQNYNTFLLGMNNMSQEQKEVIQKVHYAVQNNTPIRYELLTRLDPELTRKVVDVINEVKNEEEKYKSMYDQEAHDAVGFLRKIYNENKTKPFRTHYHE